MRIRVVEENRKSIAYALSPQELTILIPKNGISKEALGSVVNIVSHAKLQPGINQLIAKEEFAQLLEQWVNKVQVKPRRIQIRAIKNKWASCSSDKIVIFNSLLTSMPKEFAEYVICHELLHLKVFKHNKLFRSLLTAYMPDWQERIHRSIQFVLNQAGESRIVRAESPRAPNSK